MNKLNYKEYDKMATYHNASSGFLLTVGSIFILALVASFAIPEPVCGDSRGFGSLIQSLLIGTMALSVLFLFFGLNRYFLSTFCYRISRIKSLKTYRQLSSDPINEIWSISSKLKFIFIILPVAFILIVGLLLPGYFRLSAFFFSIDIPYWIITAISAFLILGMLIISKYMAHYQIKKPIYDHYIFDYYDIFKIEKPNIFTVFIEKLTGTEFRPK